MIGAKLTDGPKNEIGTVVEAVIEPESGRLRYYVVELSENQGLTHVPLSATNIPQEVLDSEAEFRLVLLAGNKKLFNAPRYDSLEEATGDAAISAASEYW